MKKLIFILTFFLLGCSINRRFIGKYSSDKNPNSFQFNSDSTFLNEYREGHGITYSTGYWRRVSKNSIVLNSKINNIDIPLTLRRLDSATTRNINLSSRARMRGWKVRKSFSCF